MSESLMVKDRVADVTCLQVVGGNRTLEESSHYARERTNYDYKCNVLSTYECITIVSVCFSAAT